MPEQSQILIIDDVSSNLMLMESILEAEGYEVMPCDDGRKALEYLEGSSQIRLILLDIMMPDFDGYEFLEQKNAAVGKDIPVIVVSAKTDTDSIQQALEKGAYDYLSKPFNIQDVLNKIRPALAKAHG